MPISQFELIMSWVLLLAVLAGIISLIVGLRREETGSKLLHIAVAIALPLLAWGVLQLGSGTEGG